MLDVLGYVLERRCPSGGYCFYCLDEPNTSDTYYALKTLSMLCVYPDDVATRSYLLSLQDEDGHYQSLDTCFFCVKGLELMGASPVHSIGSYLELVGDSLADSPYSSLVRASFLRHLYFYLYLARRFGIDVPEAVIERVDRLTVESLEDLYWLVSIGRVLGLGLCHSPLSFLRWCEDSSMGFRDRGDGALSYLEHQFMGVKLCRMLGVEPAYPGAIREYVMACRRKNGGFARSGTGIATLEYTYYAVYILKALEGKDGGS